MPYIKQNRRDRYDDLIDQLANEINDVNMVAYEQTIAGDLNYIITRILFKTLLQRICYRDINNAIGVLECIKQEIYRRQAAPYENMKAYENGDVND